MGQLRLLVFKVLAALILFSCHHECSPLPKHNDNQTDRESLLSFKSMISNETRGPLSSWNASLHFCQWPGVACSSARRLPQRVISLKLSSLGLSGSISPLIGNFTFLTVMDLSNNRLHGPIPEEISGMSRLQSLNLSLNSLVGAIPNSLSAFSQLQNLSLNDNMVEGEIPPSLSSCLQLRILNLGNNNLTGQVPLSLTNISSLSILNLHTNQFSGHIPFTIGNLESLTVLNLSENQLSGSMPQSLGTMSRLTNLYLYSNTLTGDIPDSMWNISSLVLLDLSYNGLSGMLPAHAGQALSRLEHVHLFINNLNGPIPASLSNASKLQFIDLSVNSFSGTISPSLGSLQDLQFLSLYQNWLVVRQPDGWSFLTTLTNCSNLYYLDLSVNNLTGSLPSSIGNLSTRLDRLVLGLNSISGSIPQETGNLISLTLLDMESNLLTGSIPLSIGMLENLHILDLHENKLSGEIPTTIGNLTQLTGLALDNNMLNGSIPAALGNCKKLNYLGISWNKLSGSIPKEVFSITALSRGLYMEYNSLTGLIPLEVGNLINLVNIDLSKNRLSGEIPGSLGGCQELAQLDLAGNLLHGSIPLSLGSLRGIETLDVSSNNLSGIIPKFFQKFHNLVYLNLSFNNFEGEVPRNGVFGNISEVFILGNKKLCGGNPKLNLPTCTSLLPKKQHSSHTLVIVITVIGSFLLLVLLLGFFVLCCWKQKTQRKPQVSTISKEYARVSYFDLVKATNGFSADNLIGSGSFGTVYKGILDADKVQVVAVKVLNLQVQGATESFISECEAVKNIRHRNLVSIITVCSSVDFRGNDFKAVVFEFMDNGNLETCLHAKEHEKQVKLNLVERLNIAIDVASALAYLHHQGETTIVHCDLKPSNILLDSNMTAHVSDFGLAKFLQRTISNSSQDPTSSMGLRGTIGYVAPEYGVANKVSTEGDVYSYGILLLELFTAKRPTDDMFKEGLSLRKFVESTFPEQIMNVMDISLLPDTESESQNDDQRMSCAGIVQCVASILRIGIQCSDELPADRMEMEDIISELHKIKDAFFRN